MKKMFCLLFVITAVAGFISLPFGFPARFSDQPVLCSLYSAALATMFGFGLRGLIKR